MNKTNKIIEYHDKGIKILQYCHYAIAIKLFYLFKIFSSSFSTLLNLFGSVRGFIPLPTS